MTNSRARGKGTPGRGRGRRSAIATSTAANSTSVKKTPAKRGRKPAHHSPEHTEQKVNNGSSSEDEPLVKKPKSHQPPTVR